jgi:hypothetical protein
VVPLSALAARLRSDLAEWRALQVADLVFTRREEALTIAVVLIGLSVAALLARAALGRRSRQHRIALPAVLAWSRSSTVSVIRHTPLLLFLTGLPCFILALADPHLAIAEREVSYPGRRLALLLDASSSMMVPFPSARLRPSGAPPANDALFLTTVAAAEAFVRQRKDGQYRDLVALIEFGDEAYVVTPFTSDYDNVLLSISLVGDWSEFMQFPDGGTAIGRASDRATRRFKAFDFLHAAGNVMVIFSDGQDTQVTAKGKPLDAVLAAAVEAKIPVYLIRTSRGKELGDIIPDAIWKPAIEATGGRFYAAATEEDVLGAIREIDRRSAGTIEIKRYAVQQPRFAPFATIAGALWTIGLLLKVTVPHFSKFP